MVYMLIVFCLIGNIVGKSFIDVNDILNVDFMPGSILLLEGSNSESNMAKESELLGRNVSIKGDKSDSVTGGSILEAYSTMGYHRQKMNEYLCRSFVADQILSDMSLTRIRRRLGPASTPKNRAVNDVKPKENRRKDINFKDNMLSDEGSSSYKHWLTKSTTLEDIYRHYENQMEDREMNVGGDNNDEDDDQDQDEYEGQVTGYAVQGHNPPQGPGRGSPSKLGYGGSGGGGGGGAGGGFGQSGYGGGGGHSGYGSSGYGGHDFSPQHVHYHQEDYQDDGKGEKDLKLSELFEIALTAIAFLSFGCYILQVIMCITHSSTTTTAVTMMPMMMTMSSNDNGDEEDETDEDDDTEPVRIRYKRSSEYTINERLNQLTKRVLLSIESALVAEEDEGNCLRQQLCENNKFSRNLKDNQKIWVPVWSFGMSYLTGRFVSGVPPATAMLDSLKASILGLGNANCRKIYPNCNLSKMRENRRRRRRRRSPEEKTEM